MLSSYFRRWVPLFVLLLLLGSTPQAIGQRIKLRINVKAQPLTVEDMWKVKRVGPPSIAPDGKWCVVEVTTYNLDQDDSSSNLWLLATDGKQQKQLTNTTGKNSGPKWSPDGKWIAFTSKRGSDAVAQIYVIAAAGGEARRVSEMPMAPGGLKWSAESGTLYCIGWTWPDTPDDASHRNKEKAQKASKSKALVIDNAAFRYWDRWIADGKRPVVFAVDVASGKHKNLLAGTGKFLPPFEPSARDYDVSPDGKELCFVADSVKHIGTDVNLDLYTLALDGKATPKNITPDNMGQDASPVYSPDGKSIAFTRGTVKFFTTDCQKLTLHHRATGKNRTLTDKLDQEPAANRGTGCRTPNGSPVKSRIGVTSGSVSSMSKREPIRRRWRTGLFRNGQLTWPPRIAWPFLSVRALGCHRLLLPTTQGRSLFRLTISINPWSGGGGFAPGMSITSRVRMGKTCNCWFSIRRTSTPRKSGRWCKSSTAAPTSASPATSAFAGTCNSGPPRAT